MVDRRLPRRVLPFRRQPTCPSHAGQPASCRSPRQENFLINCPSLYNDLAEAIVDPGKVVSDQYHFETITRADGSQTSGRIIERTDAKWTVATNPFDLTQTIEIQRGKDDKVAPSPVSPMPPGLVCGLNAEELKDLIAYLMNNP